ncbi:MAG: hypothetical protein IPM45_06450 [Acidimicrobiales bacterium]|nr:hypothetical protein [Acidimicrobiales bacterium]
MGHGEVRTPGVPDASSSERGASLVEYALLLGFLVAVAIGAVGYLGDRVGGGFADAATELDGRLVLDDPYALEWVVMNGGQVLPDGTIVFPPGSTGDRRGFGGLDVRDLRVMLTGQFTQGNGFGVWLRADQDGTGFVRSGYTFQVDPGLGGFVVRQWYNNVESDPIAMTAADDYDWYGGPVAVDVVVSGNTLTASVRGEEVLTIPDLEAASPPGFPVPQSGDTGVRTWQVSDTSFSGVQVVAP